MCNSDFQMILGIIITILNVIRFFIPIVLIILCTIDIFKIIVSKKEDEIKDLRKDVIRKIIYAVIIYLIPFLVPFFFHLVDQLIPFNYDDSWKECWDIVEQSKKNQQNTWFIFNILVI